MLENNESIQTVYKSKKLSYSKICMLDFLNCVSSYFSSNSFSSEFNECFERLKQILYDEIGHLDCLELSDLFCVEVGFDYLPIKGDTKNTDTEIIN